MAIAQNILAEISARAVQGKFLQAAATAPNLWENYCTKVSSQSSDETHAWLSPLPVPEEYSGAHKFEGLKDFGYNVVNKDYELAFVIDKVSAMNDSGGSINKRISQAATFWATYKDYLIATLLEAGATGTTYDGTAFFADTRVVHKSANVDNNRTQNIVATTAPTDAETLATLKEAVQALDEFTDDEGRGGFNAVASQDLRAVIAPMYRKAFAVSLNGTIIGTTSNAFGNGLAEMEVNPFLTAATVKWYLLACGDAEGRPFIYQERTPLDIQVLNDPANIALHHGLVVIISQNFRMAYGEPRRAILTTFT